MKTVFDLLHPVPSFNPLFELGVKVSIGIEQVYNSEIELTEENNFFKEWDDDEEFLVQLMETHIDLF